MESSTAVPADAKRARLPLFVGGKLRCPRCGTVSDILNYFSFDRPDEHASELNVVYKCRSRKNGEPCRFVFSPGLDDEELIRRAA